MIEKKFEAMERLLQKKEQERQKQLASTTTCDGNKMSKTEDDAPLDEHVLSDEMATALFRETSSFSVRQANSRTHHLETYGYDEEFGGEEGRLSDDEEFFNEDEFWSDDDDFKKIKRTSVKRIKTEKPPKEPKEQKEPKEPKEKKKKTEVLGSAGPSVRVRKPKKRGEGPSYVKITKDIPQDWAKHIKPYCPISTYEPSKALCIEGDVMEAKILHLFPKNKFMLCLMDPPWKRKVFPWDKTPPSESEMTNPILIQPQDLAKMDVFDSIQPGGFIVIWTSKEWLGETLDVFKQKKFDYVENFVWAKRDMNNQLIQTSSPVIQSSKETLLMFRKGKEKIELRHQRNPDFVFDFVRDVKIGNSQDKPEFTYTMIETLLPHSVFDEKEGLEGFKLLELWARSNSHRNNWAKISHLPLVPLSELPRNAFNGKN